MKQGIIGMVARLTLTARCVGTKRQFIPSDTSALNVTVTCAACRVQLDGRLCWAATQRCQTAGRGLKRTVNTEQEKAINPHLG